MISRHVFETWMTLLQDRAGRTLSPPLLAVYNAILSSELDDADFIAACTAWLAESPFLPEPAKLIERAPSRRTAALEAQRTFDAAARLMFDYAGSATVGDRLRQIELQLGPAVREAVEATGGGPIWRKDDPRQDARLRREFLDALTERRALQLQQRVLAHPALQALGAPREQLLTAGSA